MEELLQETLIDDGKVPCKSCILGQSWSEINIKMKQTLKIREQRPPNIRPQKRQPKQCSLYHKNTRSTLKLENKQNRILRPSQESPQINKTRLKKVSIVQQNKGYTLNIFQMGAGWKESKIQSNKVENQQKLQESKKEGQNIIFKSHKIKSEMEHYPLNKQSIEFRTNKCFTGTNNFSYSSSLLLRKPMILPNISLNSLKKQANRKKQKLIIHSVDQSKTYQYLKRKILNDKNKRSCQKLKIKDYIKKIQPFKPILNPFKLQLRDKIKIQ